MHRIILIKIGGKRLQLLKVLGALLVTGSALGVLSAVADIFRVLKQAELAKLTPELAVQAFGLTSNAITNDIILGMLMNPLAMFMLWLALFVIGAMVYRSGGLILPLEEDIQEEKKPEKK